MMSAVEVEESVAARTALFEEAPLRDLLLAYLAVQEGLSSDQLQTAMNGAQALRSALLRSAPIDESGALRTDWERMAPALEQAVDRFTSAPDLASARAAFVSLSENVLDAVERIDLEVESALGIYHCPMALEDRGARWIQRVGAVANPYFGASMLRCGSLQRALVAREE